MKKIGIIISSTRENRIGDVIANWILEQGHLLNNSKFELIDLKQINLPLLDEPYPAAANNYQYEHTKQWSQLINGFHGFVIVTPEYNHGYPAPIKNALDYLYTEWHNKPLAFVGYGYSASGARAVEQLRQVVSYLQLKALWNDLLINLAVVKDRTVFADENLLSQAKKLLVSLEKEVNN